MKILLGTYYLAKTGGTESYTYALAMELKRLGHDVEYFAIIKGKVSSLLEEKGVPFMSADHYDLILANHNKVVEQLWSYGYLIQTCHGSIAELEQPSPLADAYVSVSEEVRDHLQSKGFQSVIILNGIDCNRFFPSKPVSQTLTTVLSLCQSEKANDFIKKCCESENIKFLHSNKFTDNVWSIEELINQSDLVIGLGRSAYDAMACGRCALSYDYREYMGEFLGDGLLMPENIQRSMYCNCSGRASRIHYDEQSFIEEMQKYSPELATWSRSFALKNLTIEQAVQKYLGIYKSIEYRQEYNSLKLRLSSIMDDSIRKYEMILYDKEQQLKQLDISLTDVRLRIEAIQTNSVTKSRKHLCAIRVLLWFNIILILLLVVIVWYVFL